MPSASSIMPRALVIQLARLGDLLQSLPVITALKNWYPQTLLDVLCSLPLTTLAAHFPGISRSLPWKGEDWHVLSKRWNSGADLAISQAVQQLEHYDASPYSMAYNLNNHQRAVLAGYLLADRVNGLGSDGPLSAKLSPWARYLRLVAQYRGANRVHLSDAFCGLCGVEPPVHLPLVQVSDFELPRDLMSLRHDNHLCVGVVVGAGDVDRRIHSNVWKNWISALITKCPDSEVVLIGGHGERELAFSILDQLAPIIVSRVWNICGRTTLPQLAKLFSRCHWVVGSDTGPLHLGVACGAKALGFYFSNARVHETGPYGEGHWVWQAEGKASQNANSKMRNELGGVVPTYWPVKESIELLLTDSCSSIPKGWELWKSHRDQNGAFFTKFSEPVLSPVMRNEVWKILGNPSDIHWHAVEEMLQGATPVGAGATS